MKPIEELRKDFESNDYIFELIKSNQLYFDGEEYSEDIGICGEHNPNENFINGAWFMFQELNK